MSDRRFYLLALDRHADEMVWWRWNRAGYTTNLDDAGVYSEAEARSLSSGCDDPVPVRVEEAQSLAMTIRRTVIYRDGAALDRFKRSWGSLR